MNKKEQLRRLKESERENEETLRKMLTEDLTGPRAKENAAFLRKLLSEAGEDPAIYRIQFGTFSSARYYFDLCIDLEHNVVARVPGITMSKDDSLQFIWLSFLTQEAIEGFKDCLPLGFRDESDSFEFVERKRNARSKKWELVTKPIMWEERD